MHIVKLRKLGNSTTITLPIAGTLFSGNLTLIGSLGWYTFAQLAEAATSRCVVK